MNEAVHGCNVVCLNLITQKCMHYLNRGRDTEASVFFGAFCSRGEKSLCVSFEFENRKALHVRVTLGGLPYFITQIHVTDWCGFSIVPPTHPLHVYDMHSRNQMVSASLRAHIFRHTEYFYLFVHVGYKKWSLCWMGCLRGWLMTSCSVIVPSYDIPYPTRG